MALFTSSSTTGRVFPPLNVNAVSPAGKWRITSNWNDDLAGKVAEFIAGNSFEFYGSGAAPSKSDAEAVVRGARERTELGIPFTRFPVLNLKGDVIGEFAIGFDDDRRKLQIAGRGLKVLHNQGIGREILTWCLTEYIPTLRQNGIRFPVYAKDQDKVPWKDKKVDEWLDLKDVAIVATVHPDYSHCKSLLESSGFEKKRTFTKEKFVGVHDGRRDVYEFALSKLFTR